MNNQINLQGKYTNAKIFTTNIDNLTLEQIQSMLNNEITENTTVRIMPDTHYGKGATIGTTIKLPDDKSSWKIAPTIVGVDLSCAMMSYRIDEREVDLEKLDNVINTFIPAGENAYEIAQDDIFVNDLINKLTFDIKNKDRHKKTLGTLGGGNHFIELGKDESGNLWLTVHSGSRSFGAEIAKYHERVAKQYHSGIGVKCRQELDKAINELKQQGRCGEIESFIQSFKNKHVSPEIPYLENEYLNNYLNDIQLADEFARRSRKIILDIIVKKMNFHVNFSFDSVHNNIDQRNNVIRKGATSANKGEYLLIPLNMRDGSLFCIGKGNDDWNNSAPHGAGRMLSRTKAKELINFDDYKKQMSNVYTTSVTVDTIDEAPDVYKSADEIKELITDTVDIIHQIKPLYNFKAH